MEQTINFTWSTINVQQRAKEAYALDLTDDQAWDILQRIKDNYDCNYGVTWDTIDFYLADYS